MNTSPQLATVPTPPGTIRPQVATGGGPVPSSIVPTEDSVAIRSSPQKRSREEGEAEASPEHPGLDTSQGGGGEPRKKKKRKKNKDINAAM